jgi:threonine dehydratase
VHALPTIADVFAAQARLRPFVQPTALRTSAWLSASAGVPVHLKLESLNLTHSFKIRGAFNALLQFVARYPNPASRPVVVTASAGNHGRAMACAAEALGLRVVIFTPATAPRTKRDAIRRHGADLREDAPTYDEAEQSAREYAVRHGSEYVSPYNHRDVIAGAGTVGLEVVDACPDVGTVVVPLGGGGLASGVGLAIRAAAPGARVVGVEAQASTPFTAGLARGAITTIAPGPTLADGLAGNLEPGSMTFPLVQRLVDQVVVVSEDELRAAMRGMAAEEHLIVEGSAAVAVAAAAARRGVQDRPAVVLVTGANVDVGTLAAVLTRGSAALTSGDAPA